MVSPTARAGSFRSTEPGYVKNFSRRVVLDALNEASAIYWLRRAATFEAAMPRAGDFTGRATASDLAAQRARLAGMAAACRARAAMSEEEVSS